MVLAASTVVVYLWVLLRVAGTRAFVVPPELGNPGRGTETGR